MSVQVTTLPSGLAVVTDATPHVKTAAIGVFVGAGSRHESAEEHGLSHLLEHMAFKGTRRRSARDIAEAIEDAGGDLNAETGVERTGYFARVMGGDAALALDILGDILTDSQFDADELEREKNVIVQEIGAVEDAPDDLVFDLLTASAWPDQAIGRPILGTREAVGAFDRIAIDRYLRQPLQRSGRRGRRRRRGRARRDRRRLRRRIWTGCRTTAPTSSRPPSTAAAKRSGASASSRPISSSAFEGRASGAPDHDAAQVFAAAAGGGMSSRLFQEVREKRGLAYSIYSFHWDYSDAGLFGFYAGSADRDAAEVVAASIDCLAEAAHGVGENEIRRAKAQMKVSLVAALESPGARAQQIARQMQIYGRPLSFEEMIARVDAISLEDVRKTGAAMLRSRPRSRRSAPSARFPARPRSPRR